MNYLLDTCVISDFFKKNPSTITRFQTLLPSQIHISTITVMEVEYGLELNSEREKKIRPHWEALLGMIQVIPFSTHCALAAAKIRAILKKKGQLIGPYDFLIAAVALGSGMTFVTSNTDEFNRVPELHLENWRGPD